MRKRYDYEVTDEESLSSLSQTLSKRDKNSIHSLPVWVAIACVLTLGGLFALVHYMDSRLPTPLTIVDEATYPASFIAERAHRYLSNLTELGPRVAGSYENEVLTVDYLKREIDWIINRANKGQQIDVDIQVVNGSGYLEYKPFGKVFAYSNLQNVIVKLHSANNSEHSLLVNAHFDSVPTSPGGSDDGINCATMLEILRILSLETMRPLHNIIFLFNGAEETGLVASHGFITKHRWARECKVVINLEAAGAGGKIILFQTGPKTPWLLKYYKQVPHPYGQVAGEEIFQSNLVPSDTDFRIFRDYGGLVGLDMAFLKNGYRYHTKYDGLSNIPLGSLQHVGDNTLSLVRNIANAPELGDSDLKHGQTIYFDVFGWFMIYYKETTGTIINLAVAVLSFVVFVIGFHNFKLCYNFSTLKYLIFTTAAILVGWLFAVICVSLLAVFVDAIHYSMSWYGHPWIILGLYGCTTLSGTLIPFLFTNHKNLSPNVRAQIKAHLIRLIWSFVLFVGTILGVRSTYALMIPVLFNALAFMVIYIFKLQHSRRNWQIIYMAFLLIPLMFMMYHAFTTFTLFIPISGRIGPDKNVELIISLMCLFFTILVTSPIVALFTLIRNRKYFFITLAAVVLVNFIIIFTPLGFPYSGNSQSPTPQRYWLMHSRRIFHNDNGQVIKQDSGYFLLNMDRNSPRIVKNDVKEIQDMKDIEDDCKSFLLCGFPLAHPKMVQIIKYSSWIPAGPPKIPGSTKLDVLSKTYLSSTILRYNLSISGPDRLSVYFSPKMNVKLLRISLLDQVPDVSNTLIWNGRPLYVIANIWGKEAAPLLIDFDVEIYNNQNGTTTELGITGTYVHDRINQKVPHFVKFLKEFPEWADMTAWLGTFHSWFV